MKKTLFLLFLMALNIALMQAQTITGMVTDYLEDPVPGVSVVFEGTQVGTITDIDGRFSIEKPVDANILVFSFIGMQTQQIDIVGRTEINITMEGATIGLDEVVAIGYGTANKGDLTGSVSTVSTEGFERIPASDPLQAIQGRASGIQITSGSGLPGSEGSVLIRGASTIGGATGPIYVVDGVITTSIANINPNNIESISILKDAAAAAIYGARASNGVILVTTKRGKKGDPAITFNAYMGFQTEGNLRVKQLNAPQFLQLLTEAYDNDGTALPWTEAILGEYEGVNTDWHNLMLQTGVVQNYDLSVSGGTEKSNYFLSASHLDQKGMVIESAFQKSTFTINTDHKIKKWFELGNSLNVYNSSQDNGGASITGVSPYNYALIKSPLTRNYEADGDFGRIRDTSLEHMHQNPVWMAKNSENNTARKGIQGSLFAKIALFEGLDFTARGSVDYNSAYSSIFISGVSPAYGWEGSTSNFVSKEYRETMHWMTDYFLNYNTTIDEVHSISALLGYSLEESMTEDLFGSRSGTPNNLIRYLDAGDPTTQLNENSYGDWGFTSVFGRVNYNYDGKYLLSGSVRRDGSSRLAGDNRYRTYPSGSIAWRISQEAFLQDATWLDDLKLRASVGTLGNVQSVGLYATSASLSPRRAVIDQSPAAAYTNVDAVNQDLKWEKAVKKNLGIDLIAFRNMIYGSANYFIEDTYDLLFRDPIPNSSGLTGLPFINAGQIRNSGIEIEMGYRNKRGDWSYDFNLNLSRVKNEVIDLDGRDLRTSGLVEGYPVNSFFGYKTNGLISSEQQLEIYEGTSFENKKIGDIYVLDIDGYDEDGNLTGIPDGKVDAADRTIIGNRYPDLIYGGMGSISYKNWSFQFQLQGVQGVDLYYGHDGAYSMVQLMTSWARNEDARLINRFHPENNPNGSWPRLSKGDTGSNLERSDFWLEDASFLRINNVNINYNVPKSAISFAGIDQLGVYVSIQNAYTFTSYGGPEVDTSVDPLTGVPQPRTYTFGIKALF